MWFIKSLLLFFIFSGSSILGVMVADNYRNRTKELYELKKAFNFFKSRIQYTYEPLKDIFEQISKDIIEENISDIFLNAKNNLETLSAVDSWETAINNSRTSLKKNDIEIIKNFGKILGQTDINGQINQTKLTLDFIENHIKNSEEEQAKNEKLYKTLGVISGLGLVIILI